MIPVDNDIWADVGERGLLPHPCGDRIAGWLMSGGLSYPDGAVAAWREAADGSLSYAYPEITGYFLTFASATSRPQSATAVLAAQWLVNRHKDGEKTSRDTEPGVIYTFDTAVQGAGLINFGRVAGDSQAETLGIQLLEGEAARVIDVAGISRFRRGSSLPTREATWSTRGDIHILKMIQGLCLLSDVYGLHRGHDAAELMVSRYGTQVTLDSTQLRDASGHTFLHPFCYALEGLWIWEQATGDGRASGTLNHQFNQLIKHQLPSGGMPGTIGSSTAQFDVTSQTVRLGQLLRPGEPWLEKMVTFLNSAIIDLDETSSALPYNEEHPVHYSAWPSMFACQALACSVTDFDWRTLV